MPVLVGDERAVEEAAGTPTFRLNLLSGFELTCDGEALPMPLTVQRLLAFLALHDRQLHRRYVAGCLWLDATEERAAANLRATLWRIREPEAGVVASTPSQIGLAPGVAVDHRSAVTGARRLVDPGPGGGRDADGTADEAVLAGDLLPGWTDDWVVVERERLRQLRLHALEALCVRLAERGEAARAVDVGLMAVAAEPLRESAQRALIRAHLAEGNASEALRQYDTFRALIDEALGLAPSPLMEDLVAAARAAP